MSDHDPNLAPPAGEEVHLPGGSVLPILVTVGVTVTLIGITTQVLVLILGAVLLVGSIIAWVAEARAEFKHLPE